MISENCDVRSGSIISTDSDNVYLILLNGKTVAIKKNQVKFINTYNVLETPFKQIKLSELNRNRLVDIYTGKSEPLFSGWAVRFIEDLVEFIDTNGNTHVLELYQINKIRPSKLRDKKGFVLRGKKPKLQAGNVGGSCKKLSSAKSGIIPMRTLADKIQISEFFVTFDKGFDELTSYEERTYLYALPYLYEKNTIMGFTFYGSPYEHIKESILFPMYYQWARGSEYRFQSFNQIGSTPVEYSPSVEPLMVARTDLKSHLFHGAFVGNLNSLAAGTEFYSSFYDANEKHLYNKSTKSRFSPSFNYMALMGIDYEEWSFSIGTYFPIYLIQINDKGSSTKAFREVLASKVSPVFRLKYTKRKYRLRALAAFTNLSVDNVTDLDLSISNTDSVLATINSFSLENTFIRFGGDYDYNSEVQLGFDQLFHIGSYSEITSGSQNNSMDYKSATSSFKIRHSFGDYVRINAYYNIYIQERDFNFLSLSDSEKETENVLGGSFEFVF